MRLLVLSHIADWDFGPQAKAYGHEIVAWVRTTWERGEGYSHGSQTVRTIARTIFALPKPVRGIQPKFDTWTWLEKEKIKRMPCPNINTPQFVEYVKSLNIDLIVVCVFPQILKTAILRTPRFGVINCHPSLLPRYAGPQPEFWMLKNGEPVAGVTVHIMTEGIDAGDIVAQHELIVGETENIGQLSQRQHHAAATLLANVVNAIAQGTVDRKPQNIADRTYFGKKKAADTMADWNGSARQIINLLRALQPYEPLIASLNGRTIRIYEAYPQEGAALGGMPGQIIAKKSGRLLVQTGKGCLEIQSYEIVPFHGWVNRILQKVLMPSVGYRFDLALPTTTQTPKPFS
ncbi:MAG TPA: methionyl-tRNA formyltransferase [Nitrospiraceae bacterium]|nr:methionyl-tRNA formyltransferase [Nitrospiraceae bacterium]